MLEDGSVKVYLDKLDEIDGFYHAACYLPNAKWTDIVGFSEEEMKPIILELLQKEGFRGVVLKD